MEKIQEKLQGLWKSITSPPELKLPSEAISVFRKADQSNYTDPVPTYPGCTLVVHVFTKGLQLGSIVGLVLTPIIAWRRKKPMVNVWRSFVPSATVVGATFSSSMLYGKDLKGDLTIPGVDDRAYRIAHNPGQVKVDQYSLIGFGAGAVMGTIVGGSIVPLACTGIAMGPMAYLIEKKYQENKVA